MENEKCKVYGENQIDKEVKTKNPIVIKNFNDFIKVLDNNAIVEYSDKRATIEKDFIKEQVEKLQKSNEEYTIFTMIDGEGSSYSISTGYRWVNRIGFHLVKGSFIIEDENNYGCPSLLVE